MQSRVSPATEPPALLSASSMISRRVHKSWLPRTAIFVRAGTAATRRASSRPHSARAVETAPIPNGCAGAARELRNDNFSALGAPGVKFDGFENAVIKACAIRIGGNGTHVRPRCARGKERAHEDNACEQTMAALNGSPGRLPEDPHVSSFPNALRTRHRSAGRSTARLRTVVLPFRQCREPFLAFVSSLCEGRDDAHSARRRLLMSKRKRRRVCFPPRA